MDRGDLIGITLAFVSIAVTIVVGIPSLRWQVANFLARTLGGITSAAQDFLSGAAIPACLLGVTILANEATTILRPTQPMPPPPTQFHSLRGEAGFPLVTPDVVRQMTVMLRPARLRRRTRDADRILYLERQLTQARDRETGDSEIVRLLAESSQQRERIAQLESQLDLTSQRLTELSERTTDAQPSPPEPADLGPIYPVFRDGQQSVMRRVRLTKGWDYARPGETIVLEVLTPYPGNFSYEWSVTGCEGQAQGSSSTYFFQFSVQTSGNCEIVLRTVYFTTREVFSYSYMVPIM